MGIRGRLIRFIEDLIPPDERSFNPFVYRTAFLRVALILALSIIGSLASFTYAVYDLLEGDVLVSRLEFIAGIALILFPFLAKRLGGVDRIASVIVKNF